MRKPSRFALAVLGFVIAATLGFAGDALAGGVSDWRWGFSIGFGGEGITNKQTLSNGKQGTINRSEGPIVLGVFVETLVSDNLGLSFEHSRGVNFLPFSSGVSFSGIVSRYYFLGPAPSMVDPGNDSTLLIKRFVPFAGVAAGLAQASVTRDATDQAPVVSGSGVFFGMRVGADYAQGAGRGLRTELAYSTTAYSGMFATATPLNPPALLEELSIGASWYFNF